MRKLIFIRHGATAGNKEKRYIGRTDESLTSDSINELKIKQYPTVDVIYTSPMLRCIQTTEIIYPNNDYIIVDDLRECDFGKFERKNYIDLNGDEDYQAWIDSNGTLPFPDGENHTLFKNRCVESFQQIMDTESNDNVAFVIHGGTIMAILEHFSYPVSKFYDWHISNAEGFVTEFKNNKLHVIGKL